MTRTVPEARPFLPSLCGSRQVARLSSPPKGSKLQISEGSGRFVLRYPDHGDQKIQASVLPTNSYHVKRLHLEKESLARRDLERGLEELDF